MEEEHKQNQERLEFKENQGHSDQYPAIRKQVTEPQAWLMSTDWNLFQWALQYFIHCLSYYFKIILRPTEVFASLV